MGGGKERLSLSVEGKKVTFARPQMRGENENTKSPPNSFPFLSSAHPSNREITANNVRGLLSYRDTLVAPSPPRLCVAWLQ